MLAQDAINRYNGPLQNIVKTVTINESKILKLTYARAYNILML